jgi:signal peptidase II
MIQRKIIRLCLIAGAVVVLDQLSKAIITASLPLLTSHPVIPGFFNITHIHNPGGAFGFLAQQSQWLRNFVFLVLSMLAMGLVLFYYFRTPPSERYLSSGFALIFGGAVGNMIDRLRMGKVVDFLDFYLGNYHWPAFNVADSAITVGIGVFVICLVLGKTPQI